MEMSSIEKLLNSEYLTESDREILNLVYNNEDLKIIQSSDTYNWLQNKGKTESILSMAKPKNIMRLVENLDLFLVDREKLKQTSNSYSIENDLSVENFSKSESIPDISRLNMQINHKGETTKLDDYSLVKSQRYLEYPYKEEKENLNKTLTARLYSKKFGRGITIVYRQTVKDNNVIGSRLYLLDKGKGLTMIEKDSNTNIIAFMLAIDYWHNNKLKEGKLVVNRFGSGPNLPSYLSLYY